jgi:hypothetical protein
MFWRRVLVVGLVLALAGSAAGWGKKDKKEQERKYTGKENAEIGLQGLMNCELRGQGNAWRGSHLVYHT